MTYVFLVVKASDRVPGRTKAVPARASLYRCWYLDRKTSWLQESSRMLEPFSCSRQLQFFLAKELSISSGVSPLLVLLSRSLMGAGSRLLSSLFMLIGAAWSSTEVSWSKRLLPVSKRSSFFSFSFSFSFGSVGSAVSATQSIPVKLTNSENSPTNLGTHLRHSLR